MSTLKLDYVVQEVLDTVGLMQLNSENIPELSDTQIELIAEDFIFNWTEVGDYEADFSRTLLEYLRDEFKINKVKYQFNG